MCHGICELAVLDHKWRHLAGEAFDPGEKLFGIVDLLGNLLQALDQAYDVGATDLSNLHRSKSINSAQSITHDALLL